MQVVEYLRTAMKTMDQGKGQDVTLSDIVGSKQQKVCKNIINMYNYLR